MSSHSTDSSDTTVPARLKGYAYPDNSPALGISHSIEKFRRLTESTRHLARDIRLDDASTTGGWLLSDGKEDDEIAWCAGARELDTWRFQVHKHRGVDSDDLCAEDPATLSTTLAHPRPSILGFHRPKSASTPELESSTDSDSDSSDSDYAPMVVRVFGVPVHTRVGVTVYPVSSLEDEDEDEREYLRAALNVRGDDPTPHAGWWPVADNVSDHHDDGRGKTRRSVTGWYPHRFDLVTWVFPRAQWGGWDEPFVEPEDDEECVNTA
ncbi:hypothetical protein C2E23DRAFT_857559 [Lenzites betulinus]|nr:hypothetical protein C2E23DRAFT_857559 [Lenzites betulinus]